MIAFAAMTIALSLSAQPSTLQLQEPAMEVPKAAPATLGVDTHLAPHDPPNLHPNLEKAVTVGALVVGGLGCIAIVGAVTVVVVGAVLVVYVAAEVFSAVGKSLSVVAGGSPGGGRITGGYSGSL